MNVFAAGNALVATIFLIFNLKNLKGCLLRAAGVEYDGITTPFLYFGAYGTAFAWHEEDASLWSINIHHGGAGKVWYSIPASQTMLFLALLKTNLRKNVTQCPQYLKHKTVLVSPAALVKEGISVYKTVQEAGDIMITYPGGFHSGYNLGFNCAEAINYASPSWVDIGRLTVACSCDYTRNEQNKKEEQPFGKTFKWKVFDNLPAYRDYVSKEEGSKGAKMETEGDAVPSTSSSITLPPPSVGVQNDGEGASAEALETFSTTPTSSLGVQNDEEGPSAEDLEALISKRPLTPSLGAGTSAVVPIHPPTLIAPPSTVPPLFGPDERKEKVQDDVAQGEEKLKYSTYLRRNRRKRARDSSLHREARNEKLRDKEKARRWEKKKKTLNLPPSP